MVSIYINNLQPVTIMEKIMFLNSKYLILHLTESNYFYRVLIDTFYLFLISGQIKRLYT